MLAKSKTSEVDPKPDGGGGGKPRLKAEDTAQAEGVQDKSSTEASAEIKRHAVRSKQLQAAFGEIVGLLMRTPQFKTMPLSKLEELVVPAITTGQFAIAEGQAKQTGLIVPSAAVLWASVSEEVDRRLSETRDQPGRLAPKEWGSGDIPWLILAAGDQRLLKALLQRVHDTTLKGRPLKIRVAKKDDEAVATPSQTH